MAILYHYFLLVPISSALNSGPSLLVFSLLPLLAGLLPVLQKRTSEPPIYVMILLIYIVLIVTGVDALLIFANVSLTLPASSTAADAALSSAQFGGAVARGIAQEMLVLVTVGLALYLFVVVRAILVLEQREANYYDGGDLIEFAQRWMDLREYGRAVEVFDSVLARNPQNQGALADKCVSLYRLGRYQEALNACDDLLRVAPPSARLFNLRGDILTQLAHSPSARYQEQMARYAEACGAYRRAAEASPNVAMYWADLATALTALGRYEEAYSAYHRAVELMPNEAEYRLGEALMLSSLGRFEAAIDSYSAAVRLAAPGDAKFRAGMMRNIAATLTEDLDRHQDALALIEKAIELEPTSIRAWVIKGHALKMVGKAAEADMALTRALSLAPASPDTDVLSLLANAHAELGQYDQALARADQAIRINPEVRSYHQGRGDILMQMGRLEEAIKEYDLAARPSGQAEHSTFGVDVYDVLRAKAKALRALGHDDEAQRVERLMSRLRGDQEG